jgi:hypothetical protein
VQLVRLDSAVQQHRLYTQFTCFTGAKVQILTLLEAQFGVPVGFVVCLACTSLGTGLCVCMFPYLGQVCVYICLHIWDRSVCIYVSILGRDRSVCIYVYILYIHNMYTYYIYTNMYIHTYIHTYVYMYIHVLILEGLCYFFKK